MINWPEAASALGYASETLMWQTLYTKQKLSLSRLAARFSTSPQTIRKRLLRSSVSKRSRGGASFGVTLTRSEARALKAEGLGAAAKRLGVSYGTLYKRVRTALTAKRPGG